LHRELDASSNDGLVWFDYKLECKRTGIFGTRFLTRQLLLSKRKPPVAAIADEALATLTHILPRLWIEADKPFVSLREESERWAEQY